MESVKKEKRRSNSYPSITLKEAFDITEFIQKNSGYTFINLEDISTLMNKSTGAISQKIGSAVQYNLLELKSGVGYKPSELFKKILKPLSSIEKQEAQIEAFKSPKLYAELIERFEGESLPSEVILPNILEREYNIYDDAARKAAQTFIENIETLSLKNSQNELSTILADLSLKKSTENNSKLEEKLTPQTNSEISSIAINSLQNFESGLLKIEIGLPNSKKAILFYPEDLTSNDIELMKLQLSVLEKYVELKAK